jgi:hypothetical protein
MAAAKEMVKRNERAQQLRVIQVDEGSFYVESGDGKIAYKCLVTDEKEQCTCLDYQRNAPTDPAFRCKHLMAILNCAPEGGAEKKAFLKKRQPKLDERFIKNIEGKDFVLYAGLLDLAHQRGLTSIEVEIVQSPSSENMHMAIVKAYAESKLGETFSDVGDANPTNCNSKVAKHLLRMASTRAKARCLRDFTNVGMTALEELGDLNEVIGAETQKATGTGLKVVKKGKNETTKNNGTNGEPKPEISPVAGKNQAKVQTQKDVPENGANAQTQPAGMSEAQKRAMYNLSRRRGISVEELQKMAMEAYGTSLENLTAADASTFIRQLQIYA